jgi:hypothetical protein
LVYTVSILGIFVLIQYSLYFLLYDVHVLLVILNKSVPQAELTWKKRIRRQQ